MFMATRPNSLILKVLTFQLNNLFGHFITTLHMSKMYSVQLTHILTTVC
jgi:hypothetical protein